MGMKNSEILELIFKARKSVEKINNTTEDKKKIKELAKDIVELVDKMDKEIQEEEKNLEVYKNRLEEIEKEETKENTITIKNIIKSNLPKDIICKDDEDKLKLCISKIKPPKRTAVDIQVGEISIEIESLDKIDVNVVIMSDENNREQKFNISKDTPLRIYKVISYIHDNLSYDE